VVGYGSSCSTQEFEVIGAQGRSSVRENATREPMITVFPRGHLWRYIERLGGETHMGGKTVMEKTLKKILNEGIREMM